mgnify:CR=1 FL=1
MRKIFLALLILSIVLIMGLGVFVFYYYPHFVKPRVAYEDAVALYESGDYVTAAMQFESMAGYSNSEDFAKRAWLEAGNESFAAGDYAAAKSYYAKAEADDLVFAQIDHAYFELGSEAYATGDSPLGESYFLCVSEGSGYRDMMDPIRINFAESLLKNDEFTAAERIFAVCGDENRDTIAGLWYACGESKLHVWELNTADSCFAKALTYSSDKDAMQQNIDALWNEAGKLALSQDNAELADKCFARGGGSYDPRESHNSAAYAEAVEAYNSGDLAGALARFSEIPDYADSAERIEELRGVLANWFVAGGAIFYATLDENGSVATYGDWEEYTAPDWQGVKKLAVGYYRFMLGINADGTVVGSGNSSWGNLNISGWSDIVDVACGDMHSVGLRSDGTVVACGRDYYGQVSHVKDWTDIVSVGAGVSFTVGLKSDGTVVAAGQNANGECQVSGWSGIKQISVGGCHVVGLREDGTVVATGLNTDGQCNVSGWTDIVAVYAGAYHTVGLKADGTLVAAGSNSYGECGVASYRDPICVSCGRGFTLMILKDGTVVKLGSVNTIEE